MYQDDQTGDTLEFRVATKVWDFLAQVSRGPPVVTVVQPGQELAFYPRYRPRDAFDVFRLYFHPPQAHFLVCSAASFKMDVDLSDVPGRSCCGSQKQCCAQCWVTIALPAVRALRYFFVELRGVPKESLLFVFSGKKGYHLWVRHPAYAGLTTTEINALLREVTVSVLATSGLTKEEFVIDTQVSLPTGSLRCPFSVRGAHMTLPFDPDDATFEKLSPSKAAIERALQLI